ncbi:metallophosphoesterase [candidate division WOR-1 bacterium RIFOXYC2_FULL_37_10]|uniref:Metallophosphoesterase n=1 Tax=candidate division WOR-1 bacterium RIFOXYB2_FULL_37_13 TaxID=1802579 RepID=A0A1F4SDS6_UNCSA|nr:MAG: metallophosphoesterase [candidate division WOR-1 bacterium RIFOXYA2_FULL_37_7]OGC18576.1 MAG: metallophosphoesterase [candidate division WOR-1 bacterium RIFOXYB2_FULL_37_13]OGC37109.1 MAG: metallophosphoesterase [candidate division WOR-1 bacterium RIFOXYC2_FULL_37_10]
MSDLKVLFVGDIVGALGRKVTQIILPELKQELSPDIIIAQGENSAHGYGITKKIYNWFIEIGVDIISMGNHVWDKKDIIKDIKSLDKMVRPANFPTERNVPGQEYTIVETKDGVKVGFLCLVGRVFMSPLDCPFQTVDRLIPKIKEKTDIIIVDVHAEATSEKVALGYYLDGKISAVIGTHTHIITADDKILPGKTAYITDVGMVGGENSVIGMKREQVLNKFITGVHEKFEPMEEDQGIFNAVLLQINTNTGEAISIEKIIKRTDKLYP